MVTIDFSIPLAAIGVAAVSWKSILDWKNSKKMHMVTKSDWDNKVVKGIEDLREKTDKHEAWLTRLDSDSKNLNVILREIKDNVSSMDGKIDILNQYFWEGKGENKKTSNPQLSKRKT